MTREAGDPLGGITAEELRHREARQPDPTSEREFRCEECRARCTLLTDGTTEAGHGFGCPRRLARQGKGQRGGPVATDGGEEVSER